MVFGINTARSLAIAEGRVSHDQMDCISRIFARTTPTARRVLAAHHPLVELLWGKAGGSLRAAGRARLALKAALEADVHLLLAGHHHRPFSGSATVFVAAGASMLVLQAGTTTSTRLREGANSFNLIKTQGDTLGIAVDAWDSRRFAADAREAYR